MKPSKEFEEKFLADMKEHFRYEPETGHLYRTKHYMFKSWKNQLITRIEGFGYLQLKHRQKAYHAQLVCWFLYYGKWPTRKIDHINGITTDNRIVNLREVSARTNTINTVRNRAGRLVGASKNKNLRLRPWRSAIYIEGVKVELGRFDTEIEAHEAYMNKLKTIDIETYDAIKKMMLESEKGVKS